MEGNGSAAFQSLATALAEMPDVIERLLAEHVSTVDSTVPRCVSCTVPGVGIPGALWPCSVHVLATLAAEIRGRSG